MTHDLLARVEAVLESERLWAGYALADLEPPYSTGADWQATDRAVVLTYRAFDPPVLFAAGAPAEVEQLFRRIPAGSYLFTLMGSHRALLAPRIVDSKETPMWRMALRPESFQAPPGGAPQPLSAADLPAIEALFGEHPDRPDAFHPSQLGSNSFFGIWRGASLAAVAGTHVLARPRSVAAVGNVFTHPDHRGRGLATQVTSAVVGRLLAQGIRTVVLNVAMNNTPALRCYDRLGFWPFCGYYEGVGRLSPAPDSIQE